jgi:hypothetical protein
LLLGRRDFAHLNVGQLWSLLGANPPKILALAFVTEFALLLLAPLALFCESRQWLAMRGAGGGTFLEKARRSMSWPGAFCALLIAWGVAHGSYAVLNHADSYLIARQSALALYPLVAIYTLLFFGGERRFVALAAWSGVAWALVCASADTLGWLGPKYYKESEEWMPLYGQQTLPLAILGLALVAVTVRSWTWRALALAGIAFAGWRQSARPTQSVVLIGIGGALILYTLFAAVRAIKGQRQTLKRALTCLLLFVVLGASWRVYKLCAKAPETPGTETGSEIGAWGPSQYADLLKIYYAAEVPRDPAAMQRSWRPPYDITTDPEYYRLQAVFLNTPSVSVRNNVWRLLVWRHMAIDWAHGSPLQGAGVGKPWFYEALYHTGFHYGDDREGLDPHNSYLNTLYRFGIVGFGLLLAIFVSALAGSFSALRERDDPLMEGLLLYFFYTAIFVFFTVGLEGSPYAFPIWMTLGLLAGLCLQHSIAASRAHDADAGRVG